MNKKSFSTISYLALFLSIITQTNSVKAIHSWFDFALPFENQTNDLIIRDMRDEKTPQIIITLRKDDIIVAIDFKNKTITNKDITIKPTTESVDITTTQSKEYTISVHLKNIHNQSHIAYALEKNKQEKSKEAHEEVHMTSTGSRFIDQMLNFEATDAELSNGVLSLTIPYKKAKDITIKIK